MIRRAAVLTLLLALLARPTFAQYKPPGEAGLPALQKATVTIAPAQQATLFSAPVTIVAGTATKIYIVEWFHVRKEAGTGWTTTGSGTLRITYDVTPFSLEAGIFDQAGTTQFFSSLQAVWTGPGGKGQFQALGNTTGPGPNANNVNGAGLRIALGTADISGGTGNLIVTVWYRTFDGF